jgi:hypothetical protein
MQPAMTYAEIASRINLDLPKEEHITSENVRMIVARAIRTLRTVDANYLNDLKEAAAILQRLRDSNPYGGGSEGKYAAH